MISITTIGHLISSSATKSKTYSCIRLIDDLNEDSLRGLQGGDEVYVIFYHHHQSRFDLWAYNNKLATEEAKGIFSEKIYPRPNNLEVLTCTVESVEQNTLWINRLDIMPGTPVIDIQKINQ
ncbi:MAG: SAM-dependent methyltransferase [Cyclobacteriaceae bacterium]|nr:SAM-dependent methyltransferase [Cyclobacteriaceae bacterium]